MRDGRHGAWRPFSLRQPFRRRLAASTSEPPAAVTPSPSPGTLRPCRRFCGDETLPKPRSLVGRVLAGSESPSRSDTAFVRHRA